MKSGILKPGDLVTCTYPRGSVPWLDGLPKDYPLLVMEVHYNQVWGDAAGLLVPERVGRSTLMNVGYLELVEAG